VRGTRRWLHAVDDVSFSIERGECVGLVGESGCGKSTLVRLLARLVDPTAGRVVFDGRDVGAIPARRFAREPERARIQMVFQDPADSLNPRFTAFATIAEPLRRLAGVAGDETRRRVESVADLVGLPRELLGRFPHQLSGGQQQRVGIARAVALEPALLVLDEPTSALDVSVQAAILNLLVDLQAEHRTSYVFISHDLGVVRYLADRIAVLYLGRLMELGTAQEVFEAPHHPYTEALLSAVPSTDPSQTRIKLAGDIPSAANPPSGCVFQTRCPRKLGAICEDVEPPLADVGGGRLMSCHIPLEELRRIQATPPGTAP
jgi:peptide/nickel transport system ATP-binding protein